MSNETIGMRKMYQIVGVPSRDIMDYYIPYYKYCIYFIDDWFALKPSSASV